VIAFGSNMPKQPDDSLEAVVDSDGPERSSSPPITRELQRVEEANFAFYEAFHLRDIQRMERLWSRSPHTRCIHPGWEPVVGWSEIRQSWVDIFRTMKMIEFSLEDVHVEVADGSAWVNLVAHAEVQTEDDEAFTTSVVATTIFEKIEGQWYIVLHHSSHFADDDELEDEDEIDMDGADLTPEGGSGDSKPN
jgi:ketosteroid isomerase-like protein